MTGQRAQGAVDATERPAEPVLFDAVLYPHRSLGPAGFRLLMAAVAVVAGTIGLMFFLRGAWPITGLLGLDVLLLWWAFRASYRSGRMRENVRLTPSELVVTRTHPNGRAARWTFQPSWLRVDIDDPPRHESQVTLSSHGRRVVVGSFLSPEERADFARALRAALDRIRAVPA